MVRIDRLLASRCRRMVVGSSSEGTISGVIFTSKFGPDVQQQGPRATLIGILQARVPPTSAAAGQSLTSASMAGAS